VPVSGLELIAIAACPSGEAAQIFSSSCICSIVPSDRPFAASKSSTSLRACANRWALNSSSVIKGNHGTPPANLKYLRSDAPLAGRDGPNGAWSVWLAQNSYTINSYHSCRPIGPIGLRFGFIVIVEEGLSHAVLTQTQGCEPIIVNPNGNLTINYLDTCEAPLSPMHLAFSAGLCMLFCGNEGLMVNERQFGTP
jgi:hypothetical protein